jgi:hypothetical protein
MPPRAALAAVNAASAATVLTSQLVVQEKQQKVTKHRLPLMQQPQPDATATKEQDAMQLDAAVPQDTTRGGCSTGSAFSAGSEQHEAAPSGVGTSAGAPGQNSMAGRSSGPIASQAIAQHSTARAGSRQLGSHWGAAANSSSSSSSTNAQPYLQHLLLDAIATKLAGTGESVLNLLQ